MLSDSTGGARRTAAATTSSMPGGGIGRRSSGGGGYTSYDLGGERSGYENVGIGMNGSDEAYEAVPLRGAGRSLAQRAQGHLKSIKQALKNAFSDSPSGTPTRATIPTATYGNAAYSGHGAAQRTGQLLSRAHARTRSIDLAHVIDDLDSTLEGALVAATLLQELRDSGGDPEADRETNDALDLELSDVCEAHRAHLAQVAVMTDDAVSLSEAQLGTLLETLEKLNAAISTLRRELDNVVQSTPPGSVPTSGPPSLGTSRIECATTEEEEAAMISAAIAASLTEPEPVNDSAPQAQTQAQPNLIDI